MIIHNIMYRVNRNTFHISVFPRRINEAKDADFNETNELP